MNILKPHRCMLTVMNAIDCFLDTMSVTAYGVLFSEGKAD